MTVIIISMHTARIRLQGMFNRSEVQTDKCLTAKDYVMAHEFIALTPQWDTADAEIKDPLLLEPQSCPKFSEAVCLEWVRI